MDKSPKNAPTASSGLLHRSYPASERTPDAEAFFILEYLYRLYAQMARNPNRAEFSEWFVDPAAEHPARFGDEALRQWQEELQGGRPSAYHAMTLAAQYAVDAVREQHAGSIALGWVAIGEAHYWRGRATELGGELLMPDRASEIGRKGGRAAHAEDYMLAKEIATWCEEHKAEFRNLTQFTRLAAKHFPGPESTLRVHIGVWRADNF